MMLPFFANQTNHKNLRIIEEMYN